MTRTKCLISWSSGKDSAWMVHVLQREAEVEIVGLLSVVSERTGRVAMHGVDVEVLRAQARALGLPLRLIRIPEPCSDAEYAAAMESFVDQALRGGIEAMAFGDVFLEDVRAYREERLRGTGITPRFPLWGARSDRLVRTMLRVGLRAPITAVDTRRLSADLIGQELTQDVIDAFPSEVDPCGENGEYHTVVTDAPIFAEPVYVEFGDTVEQDGFAVSTVRLSPQSRNLT